MERKLFKDIQKNQKETVHALFKEAVEKLTKSGSTYLNITLSDGQCDIKANMWSIDRKNLPIDDNTVVSVTVEASDYNGQISYTIRDIQPSAEVSKAEFIPTAPIEPEELFEKCIKQAELIKNDALQVLVKNIYESNKEKLLHWGAAATMHHNIVGGLLWHSYRMAENAINICETYNSLNRDLLIAGTLLHDMGKLWEMETDECGTSTYTTNGTLFGHLYIGANYIHEQAKGLLDDNTAKHLEHMIASHHGKLEWGAISVPHTPEAQMLHYIDKMDAVMYVCEKTESETEEGSFSDPLKMLDGAKLYKFPEI